MKILLSELIQASRVFNTKVFNIPMEFKLSYRLIKLTKKINSEVTDFEKARNELIKKYGKTDEKGITSVPKDKIEEFSKELEPVLAEELKMDISLIPYNLLEKSKIELSANDLIAIEKFIEEPIRGVLPKIKKEEVKEAEKKE